MLTPRGEWLFRHFGFLSVTLSHYEVERAQNSWNVRDHVVNEEVGKNREVYEGRSSDFQPVRDPSSLGVDVESQLTLGVLGAKINLAFRSLYSLCGNDKMVNEFLHFHHNFFFVRKTTFGVYNIDWTIR